MSSQELEWGKPGPCPSCGAITDHHWFSDVRPMVQGDGNAHVAAPPPLFGSQGQLLVSKCVSQPCQSLAVWIRGLSTENGISRHVTYLVYPQAGVRVPPEEGLELEEVKLYEEASDVAGRSPRAACALVRVLLEMLLKRHLAAKNHLTDINKRVPLAKLIEMAVDHLDLTPTLETGLNAIRERGNTVAHDPYSLTDDIRTEDLPWLFTAVDDLVDDLHVKPKKWGGMTEEPAEDDYESTTGST